MEIGHKIPKDLFTILVTKLQTITPAVTDLVLTFSTAGQETTFSSEKL